MISQRYDYDFEISKGFHGFFWNTDFRDFTDFTDFTDFFLGNTDFRDFADFEGVEAVGCSPWLSTSLKLR